MPIKENMMFIMYLRISGLVLFTIFCLFLVILFYPIMPKHYWVYFVKMWAHGTLKLVGVKIQANNNNYIEHNAMVVANHISWLDIPILYTQYSVGFVARKELQKWPILGWLIKSGSTIFIDRSRKRDLIHINKTISKQLICGANIGVFPEGRTSSGLEVLPFKSSIFEAALIADSTIIPMVIQYYTKDGIPTNATTYEGKITLWQSLKNSLQLNGIIVKIIHLPREKAHDFKDRENLSNYLYNQINNQFQIYLQSRLNEKIS